MRHDNGRPMIRAALGLVLALVTASAMAATPPSAINYQGVLRDADDVPSEGTFDMVFSFHDAEVGGGEILVDEHTGPDAVAVTGGLFSVALGTGDVSDGATAYPGDPYTSLAEVFQDFGEVWLEIEIGGETLSPRVQVLSAPYALNAAQLGGLEAGNFLDTSATPQTKLGRLTSGGVDVQGSLRLTDEFFTAIYFSEGGDPQAESFSWDSADGSFEASDGLQLAGPLSVGDTTSLPPAFSRFGPSGFFPAGSGFDGVGDVYVADNFEVDGVASFSGAIIVDNDGPDGDQRVRFYNDGFVSEELKWDEAGERFELSDALALAGSLRTGQTQAAPEAFNHFGDLGNSPDSEDITGPQDLYIEGDLEVEERIYLGGQIVMLDFGPDADGDGDAGDDIDQWIFFYDGGRMDDEWLTWENDVGSGQDRFELSDSLHVFGDLTALNKNFVQNHPQRDDLEIVYTSLEGDEATVFTRGHGRLEGGVARVQLGESFAWVAHPEMGLSAHLTPRGQAAGLWVDSLTTEEIVVRGDADVSFDFIVYGLRLGYEDQPVVRPRRADAPLPQADAWDVIYAEVPEAHAVHVASRYASMNERAFGRSVDARGGPAARALREAIGERDREEPLRTRDVTMRDDTSLEPRPAGGAPRANASSAPQPVPPALVGSDDDDGAATGAPMRARSFLTERSGIAGRYAGDGAIAPGDVVVLDTARPSGMRRADAAEDPTVIGVATTEAGVVFGAAEDASEPRVTVALGGIVPCKVDASYGAILPGDLLVSSPTPGHAMRREQPLDGTVLGKALEPLHEGTGTVMVLIMQR